MRISVIASFSLLLGAGCASPRPATWWLEFESSALEARASIVEASILEGGCSGTNVLYTARFEQMTGLAPPVLGPGEYGFAARARDADCGWYAAGCVNVTLPAGGTTTRLLSVATVTEPGCDLDAGMDAARADAGVDAPRADTSTPIDVPVDVSARPPCATTFGGATGFVLCMETETTCRFYANTGGSDCDALCQAHGSTCIAEENDDSAGAACDALSASTCSSNGSDAICTCNR